MHALYRALTVVSVVILASSDASAHEVDWVAPMGGPGDDYAFSVAVDTSGSTYVAGSFQNTATPLTGAGFSEAFVASFDAAGNVLWALSMGGPGGDTGRTIALDTSGNAYVAGSFQGTATFGPYTLESAANSDDVFVAKLDASGSVLWAKGMGGSAGDQGHGIAVDPGGNAHVTGYFQGTASFGSNTLTSASGSFDVFVEKLDTNGDVAWAVGMGGTSEDWAFGLALDANGNSHVAGRFAGAAMYGPYALTSSGSWDAFVQKVDPNGGVLWAKRMGGAGSDMASGIAVDADGSSYVTGSFMDTATFGPHALLAAGGQDAFVEKLDAGGDVLWAQSRGRSSHDWGNDVATDASGGVYVTGRFAGTVAFGDYHLVSSGNSGDGWVEKLGADGYVLWARRMGGPREDVCFGVAVDTSGNVYASGRFSGTSTIGPYTFTAGGRWDAFVERLAPCGSFVDQSTYGALLFPPSCTQDATSLSQDVYGSLALTLHRGPLDRLYLSSERDGFSPLVVDDAVRIDGVDAGLGPYTARAGVPPFVLNAPIEESLVPLPAHEVTSSFSVGQSTVRFELADTDRQIYGNTPVYLVRDCGLRLAGAAPTYLYWVTHDDQVAGAAPEFDVRYGLISELRLDRGFARARCLDWYFDSPVAETLAPPPPRDGYYFLARGVSSCLFQGYGDSSLVPDPRAALDALPVCP
jgi:hypothetical protein